MDQTPAPLAKTTILRPEKRSALNHLGNKAECTLPDTAVAVVCSHGGANVRLLNGVAQAFGLLHIEDHDGRILQIKGLGYRDAHQYVADVMANFTAIGLQADLRINLLMDKHGYWHHLICEWDEALQIWSVTTAIPKRHKRNVNVVWKK